MSTSSAPTKSPEQLLKEHGLFKQPVNVEALAEALGIAVKYEELEDDFSAFLMIKHGKPTAFVNGAHHLNRRRFSLAHEIGHFIKHYKKTNRDRLFLDRTLTLYTRKENSASENVDFQMEREANVFAAGLLMPDKLLKEYISRHDLNISDEFDVSRLAIAFGVSEQALQIRLNNLKLAKPNF